MFKGRFAHTIAMVSGYILGVMLMMFAWPVAARAAITDTVALSVTIDVMPPEQVVDLTAVPGTLEGTVNVTWTSPHQNNDGSGGKVSRYVVKYATFSVASLGSTTTAWWEHAGVTVGLDIPSFMIHDPGIVESNSIIGLEPGVTYYYGLAAEDAAHLITFDQKMSGVQSRSYACDVRPDAPTGLMRVSQSTSAINIAWDDMSGRLGYADFDHFEVYRSTYVSGYILLNTTTLSSYTDVSVTPETTYYYVLRAVDGPPQVLASDFSAMVMACATRPPDPIIYNACIPRAPSGIKLEMTSTTRTIRWSRVVRNSDGTPYKNHKEYQVFRSGESILGWVQIASVGGFVDSDCVVVDTAPLRGTYYYKVRTVTTSDFVSPDSMLADTSFNIIAVSNDESAIVTMPVSVNSVLYKGETYPDDVNIVVEGTDEQPATGTISVYEVNAVNSQTDEKLNAFHFPATKAKMVYFCNETNGGGAAKAVNKNAGIDMKNIAFFWYNGVDWVKMSSALEGTTVVTQTSRLGKYMLKESLKATTFKLTRVYPQTFSPNGDNRNDHVEFLFENPADANPSGKIYDMHGALIAELKKGLTENSLMWDGVTTEGSVAAPGAYIYQIEVTGSESKILNGVVVVAK